MHALKFILHQFLADTRRHRWFIVGYACMVAILAWANTNLSFEFVVDDRGIPRTEYQIMVILITLLPAGFMVPFLVFADPVDAPDAFWRVKPLGSINMVGAKILWVLVWLIGMPFLGECISVIALGGVTKLPYIAVDFIGLHSLVIFMILALATLTNEPFKFLVGLVTLFLSFFLIGSLISALMNGQPLAYRVGLIMTNVMICFAILGSLFVAIVQYRWRLNVTICFPLVIFLYATGLIIKQQTIDFSHASQVPSDSPFNQMKMDLSQVGVNPGKRTLEGKDPDVLRMTFTLDNIPPMSAVGLGEMDLNVDTGHKVHTFSHLPSYAFPKLRKSDLEVNQDLIDRQLASRKVIYKNLLRQLRGHQYQKSNPLVQEIAIPIPEFPGMTESSKWKISGVVRYHCFSYNEFGRFPIDTKEIARNITLNKNTRLDFQKDEVFFRCHWEPGYARYPRIWITNREVSSWLDPMNLDSWTYGNPIPGHWFFYLHNTAQNEFWENPGQINSLHANGVPWSSLFFGFTSIQGPEVFSYDEWIAFRARFVGCIEFPFKTEILSTP